MIGGVVLAGGAGRRMGGVDKAALVVGGATLLDRVLAAARPVCDRLVVVGPARATAVDEVTFVVEDAPGGGPVPAVAAGVGLLGEVDLVVVLAVDLPLLGAEDLRRLLAALDDPGVEAAGAADEGGPNPLLAAYRAGALRRALAGLGPGAPARRLLPRGTLAVDLGPAVLNVNTPADLVAAADRLEGSRHPGAPDPPIARSSPGTTGRLEGSRHPGAPDPPIARSGPAAGDGEGGGDQDGGEHRGGRRRPGQGRG